MQRPIDLIVVHCADTPPSMDIGAKEIDQWHKERGWSGIGYHYVIRRDGRMEHGRPVSSQGAHVAGYNAYSIGICMVGGKGGFNFTKEQMDTLADVLATLTGLYPAARVCGHRDLDKGKECPTFDVDAFWKPIKAQLSAWRS